MHIDAERLSSWNLLVLLEPCSLPDASMLPACMHQERARHLLTQEFEKVSGSIGMLGKLRVNFRLVLQ